MKQFIFSALLCASAQAMALTDIPLPGDLFYPGSITVQDSTNTSHAKFVEMCQVSYSKKFDVTENKLTHCSTHNINEAVHLPSGVYFLKLSKDVDNDDPVFNFSRTLVTLQEGQQLVVPLVSQTIARSNGEFSIDLFRDLSNANEVDQFLQLKWADGLSGMFSLDRYFNSADWYCRKKKMRSVEVAACRAFKAKDYKGLAGAFKFNKDGSYALALIQDYVDEDNKLGTESWDYDYFAKEAGNLKDGDSIAVFPGTLLARFRNSVGYNSTTQGIDFH